MTSSDIFCINILIRNKNTAFNRRDDLKKANLFYFWSWTSERKRTMLESKFQAKLIKDLKDRFEGCIVLKNDADYIQGVPDLMVLYQDKWAALECKRTEKAKHQPNQDYYVERMNTMSFARYIYPENRKEVLDDLERAFRATG